MFSSYGKLSTEVYNIQVPPKRSYGDLEFYSQRLKGVTGHILEPGVGTGRVLIHLLSEGYKMEGFDLSPEMLEECKRRIKEGGFESRVWVDDISKFEVQRAYDAIILPNGNFLFVDDRDQSVRGLELFHKALKPGGKLLVDLFYMYKEPKSGYLGRETFETADGHVITVDRTLVDVDFFRQRTVTHFNYGKWKNGHLVDSELQKFSFRWYGVDEFRMLLESIGYKDVKIILDYDEKKPMSAANYLSGFTFEATKA